MVDDFTAIACGTKGRILNQCAILTDGIYTDYVNHPLFYDASSHDGIWSKTGQDQRYDTYSRMVKSGSRMVASVNAINRWLAKAAQAFNPIMTAYNLPFDVSKCRNTGIDLTFFDRSFCLWSASYTAFCRTKAYRQMVLDCHAFNMPTLKQNMTFKTNAETMARFVLGNSGMPDEPHTALEDIVFYEKPILDKLLRRKSTKWLLNETESYAWQHCQVKDWFKPL